MMNLNNHLTIIIYLFKIIRKFGETTKNFSEYESEEFLKFSLFDYLKNQFGFLKVADIEGIGYQKFTGGLLGQIKQKMFQEYMQIVGFFYIPTK